jgi:hypothetical protein
VAIVSAVELGNKFSYILFDAMLLKGNRTQNHSMQRLKQLLPVSHLGGQDRVSDLPIDFCLLDVIPALSKWLGFCGQMNQRAMPAVT